MSHDDALTSQFWSTADATFETALRPKPAVAGLQIEKQLPNVLENSEKHTEDDDGSRQVVVSCYTGSSIYEQYSQRHRWFILAVVSITSIIVPLTDTIYLPGLAELKSDFATNEQMTALSVSLYLMSVGISALVWGNLSDRFGRRPTYLGAAVAFIATSVGCIFTKSLSGFIICRMLQGLTVPPFTTNSTAVVADVFPPRERGMAMGIRSLPLLVGPVLGPLLGGLLCQAFGWRSTFILLAAMAAAVLPLLLLVVPETHQYLVFARLQKNDPAAAALIEEAAVISSHPPQFRMPWAPLASLFSLSAAVHCIIATLSFGAWFAVLGELSTTLAAAPYSLSQAIIGVCFLPMGVAGMVASPLGGWLADRAAAAAPNSNFARLTWGTGFTLLVMPGGLLLFGWSLNFKLNITAPFVGSILTAVASFAYMPGYFSWLSNKHQQTAASVTGAAQALLFLMAGVIFQSASAGVASLGNGWYFTVLAGIQGGMSLLAVVQFAYNRSQAAAAAAARDAKDGGNNSGL